jgi:tetratricopeptide (TPR) repeat protein
MRIVSTLALAIALGSAVTAVPAFAQKKDKKEEAPAAKYTPAVQKALLAAQTALKANDTATALAQVAAAKAAGLQTADDKNATGSLEYQIYQITKDQALLSDGVDLMIASGKAGANAGQLYAVQSQIAFQAKDYAKASASATEALKAGSTEPNLVPIQVTSLSNQGQILPALNTLNESIDRATAAGQPVPAEWFQRGLAIGYTSKATADAAAISEATSAITRKWVAAYPTKQNWNDALITYLSQYKPPVDVQVDTFRLMRAVGALMSDGQYREYAADIYLRFPGETVAVLEEGGQKGVVNLTGKNDATDLLAIVKPKVAGDKASLAASDKTARTAADGRSALTTADAYVGYGMYAQAIDLYKVALTKGADAGTVNLHMGWALAMSGDAAGAKAAFQAVTGTRKPLADFWVVHLDHPTAA